LGLFKEEQTAGLLQEWARRFFYQIFFFERLMRILDMKPKNKLRNILLLAALLLLAAPSVAQANLILNPSFEDPGANWTYDNVDWWTGAATAKDGVYIIDLNSSTPGSISQSFATTIGQQYGVTFWLAGNPEEGSTTKYMQVTAGNVPNRQFSFDINGYTLENMGWTEKSFLFTATGTTTTLLFESLSPGWSGAVIDLVSVDAVPLPATLLLLGSGLVGLLGAGRRWRKL